ncbi:transposase [Streptomyces sp. NPDC054940]
MALDEEIAELDTLIETRVREHPHAEVILSLPGMGPKLAAEFIAATSGDLSAFRSADRPAGFAGVRTDRTVLNRIVWKSRTCTAWRDISEQYGPWATLHTRLRRRAARSSGYSAPPRPGGHRLRHRLAGVDRLHDRPRSRSTPLLRACHRSGMTIWAPLRRIGRKLR